MDKECKFIKSIRKRQNIQMLVLITLIIYLGVIHIPWKSVPKLFQDIDGTFSNEILWTGISAIGGILAFIGVIITIFYTEGARTKQNEYEYYKRQREEIESEFRKEVKKQIDMLNPINAIEVMITNVNDNTYMEISKVLNTYICKIKSVYWNINWYYKESDLSKMIKYNEFIVLLEKEINKISSIVNNFNSYTINWFTNKSIYRNLRNLDACKQLTDEEKKEYDKLRTIYESEKKQKDAIDCMLQYQMQLVKINNEEMSILVFKAKEMINEREQMIKEELKKYE